MTQFDFSTSKTLATTGNLRLVTERLRFQADGSGRAWPIVCTEPSPDYAIAFGTTASANAKVDITGAGSGEGGGSLATSEAATALAGRTAGVLALRDGLYAACQSYANGVIGHDAYAMILSQYGTLLVALAGGSDSPTNVTGGAGAITVNVNAAAQPRAAAHDAVSASRQATRAALLVACISAHDPTRLPYSQNPLFSERFCRDLLEGAKRQALRS